MQPSANITTSIGFQLARVLKLKRKFIDGEMKKIGLSRTQWQTLLWMKILGPCSQKELLQNLDIDAGHLTRVLDEFEKNKYITRTAVADDRRALFIQMTKRCEQKLIPHLENSLAIENALLLKGLSTNENKMLAQLLQKLAKNMTNISEYNHAK